tara:strand:+ start:263 stop:1228 length:966 start_codon:yes stop_codon:yes gene_type:complete
MDIEKLLKKVKPNASDTTIKSYSSNIKILYKLLNSNNTEIKNLKFLENPNQILSLLSNKVNSTIKNYLNSIVVLLKSDEEKYEKLIEKYSNEIKKIQNKMEEFYDQNIKSEKQSKNWVEYDKIVELYNQYKKEYNSLIKKNSVEDIQKSRIKKDLVKDTVLLALYSGVYFPPVRNDFNEMEVINEGESMDNKKNYMVLMNNNTIKFVFNEFKTSKSKGSQEIIIKNKTLIDLLLKHIEIHDKDFLLINSQGNPLTANGLTKQLNTIFKREFDKSISSSLLRNIYISHMYNDKNLSSGDKKKLAEKMLHSKSIAEDIYQKID